jgi:hypothetical protein
MFAAATLECSDLFLPSRYVETSEKYTSIALWMDVKLGHNKDVEERVL